MQTRMSQNHAGDRALCRGQLGSPPNALGQLADVSAAWFGPGAVTLDALLLNYQPASGGGECALSGETEKQALPGTVNRGRRTGALCRSHRRLTGVFSRGPERRR